MNATQAFAGMDMCVKAVPNERWAKSPCQPMHTKEALPFRTFSIYDLESNVPAGRRTNLRWAAANLLHFFADTEEAEVLFKYNVQVARYLTGTRWVGAYGAIAMPQLRQCVELLKADNQTRRAVVSMGGPEHQDINRPACWSMLHFLDNGGRLNMYVYQRSLNLYGVMPYDCVVLTNVLLYVAKATRTEPGTLVWTVGSLHTVSEMPPPGQAPASLVLPFELASDSAACRATLMAPENMSWPIGRELLCSKEQTWN